MAVGLLQVDRTADNLEMTNPPSAVFYFCIVETKVEKWRTA